MQEDEEIEASEAWVSEMSKMSGEEMCMWEDGGLNSCDLCVCPVGLYLLPAAWT